MSRNADTPNAQCSLDSWSPHVRLFDLSGPKKARASWALEKGCKQCEREPMCFVSFCSLMRQPSWTLEGVST
jgi:hypothetical protein